MALDTDLAQDRFTTKSFTAANNGVETSNQTFPGDEELLGECTKIDLLSYFFQAATFLLNRIIFH